MNGKRHCARRNRKSELHNRSSNRKKLDAWNESGLLWKTKRKQPNDKLLSNGGLKIRA
jgi:hypothetical protein